LVRQLTFIQGYPNYTTPDFFSFCANVTNINAPPKITALDTVLANYTNNQPWTNLGNYATYVKENIVSSCQDPDLIDTTSCFSRQNKSFYADTSNSGSRSYLYTTCAEGGFYQVAPATGPSLISRVLQVDYTQQWCSWAFGDSIPSTPNLTTWNQYGGLNFSADRLAFIDGEADVWRDVCYHSEDAPEREGGEKFLLVGGGHHWDSYGILDVDAEPQYVTQAHEWEIRTVKKWLRDFPQWKKGKGKSEL